LDGSGWRFSAKFAPEGGDACCHPFQVHQTEKAYLQCVTLRDAVMPAVAGDNSPVQLPGISVGLLAVLVAYTGSQFAPSLLISAFLN
jgi:hypothetical protein